MAPKRATREAEPSAAEAPRRIRLSRAKGWRMPPNTVKVDRTTCWGNPFIVNPHVKAGSRSGALYICVPTPTEAIECFRLYCTDESTLGEMARRLLRGKNLACWCKLGEPCHADVLLELANRPAECDADDGAARATP